MTPLKQNVPGYIDEQGRFRPIRSAEYVGSGSSKRRAKKKDVKKYSRAKAGDLGKKRQERALEDPWDREKRLEREQKAADARWEARELKKIAEEVYGESVRTSRGKPQSLAQFVRSKGGLRKTFRHGGKAGVGGKKSSWDAGEINRLSFKGSGSTGLTTERSDKGLPLDKMFQAARESGYNLLDIDDMMDKLETEVYDGRPTYATHGALSYNPVEVTMDDVRAVTKLAYELRSSIMSLNMSDYFALQKKHDGLGGDSLAIAVAKDLYFGRIKRPAWVKKDVVIPKRNPDLISTFASLAGGVASAMNISEAMERRKKKAKKKAAPKKRNPRTAKVSASDGELYVLTISSGDDTLGIYLHDGKMNGISKKFKSLASARTWAKRNKRKLVENPLGLSKLKASLKRALARQKAANELKRELRTEAKLERIRSRKAKAMSAARANPPKPVKTLWVVQAKDSWGYILRTPIKADAKHYASLHPAYSMRKATAEETRQFNREVQGLGQLGFDLETGGLDRLKSNPKPVPRRRTYEMFQGRKATKAEALPISRHAPQVLDQLGDLVELKLNSGRVLKFPAKKYRLCASGGKLWIAGGKFAKANPAAKANEINPVDAIDHIVYGTRKPHHGDHAYTHYIHRLGEESGHQPTLCVDKEGFPVIRGGRYKIEARGIVN